MVCWARWCSLCFTGGGDDVIAILFKVSQRRDSFLTRLATDGGQQEDREALYLAAEFSIAALIQPDKEGQGCAEKKFHHMLEVCLGLATSDLAKGLGQPSRVARGHRRDCDSPCAGLSPNIRHRAMASIVHDPNAVPWFPPTLI